METQLTPGLGSLGGALVPRAGGQSELEAA